MGGAVLKSRLIFLLICLLFAIMSLMPNDRFDYTEALHRLCRDICRKLSEFRNIDTELIGYSFSLARNTATRVGGWASVTPLRFENGSSVTVKERLRRTIDQSGKPAILRVRMYYKTPTVYSLDGRELLYIFDVMAPRFLNLSVTEKINTVMHELYHIDPRFNGDVRRFPGHNWQHGNMKAYEAKAASLGRQWLATEPDPRLYDFLKYNAEELRAKYTRIVGAKFRKIPLVPITEEEAFRLEPGLRI